MAEQEKRRRRAQARMARGACQKGLALRAPAKWKASSQARPRPRACQALASAGSSGICVTGASRKDTLLPRGQ